MKFKKGDLIRWKEDNDLAIVVSVNSSTGELRIKWLTMAEPENHFDYEWEGHTFEVSPHNFVHLSDNFLT